MQLASREVHWWRVGLDVPLETSADLFAMLTQDEQNRSGRLRFECDRRRFIVARGALRDLLGRYLGTRPGDIRFVTNAFGKPELSPEFGGRLRFNLSHSADLALIAIAADSSVGIDLEVIRARPDHAEVARHFFSPAEFDDLRALPSHLHADAFFGCWTKKEAYLKARGEGLALPLSSFSVPLTADPAQAPVDVHGWSLHTLRPAPGYAGALAVEGTGWRLREGRVPDQLFA